MAKLEVKNGITSVILRIKIMDSTSTTGAGKTGLTSASSGLLISTIANNEATPTVYSVAGSTIETIATLGTFATPTATKCRFKEVDATNHPGLYEIQLDNARWAVSGARSLIVSVSGATGAAPVDAEIQLVAFDALDSVRLGLTALPNAAAGANGGLPLGNASGRVDVGNWLGTAPLPLSSQQVQSVIPATTVVASVTGNVGGNVTGSVGSVTGAVGSVTGNVGGSVASVTADVGITQAGADKVWGTAARSLTTFGSLVTDVTTAVWAAGTRSLTTFGTLVADVQSGLATAANQTTINNNILAIPAAIWNYLTSAATTAGSLGKLLVDTLNATIGSRMATFTYTAPDNASITAIKNKTDQLNFTGTDIKATLDGETVTPADGSITAAVIADNAIDAAALATDVGTEIADALLDRAAAVETGLTLRQALRLLVAAEAGKLSGAETTTITIRNAVADNKNRITATVDSDGNRTAVVYDLT